MSVPSVEIVSHGEYDGEQIVEYRLSAGELQLSVLNIGASITRLLTPDAEGNSEDIVLGYDTWQEYLDNTDSFGCLTGRFANRISGAAFKLNGQSILVSANEGENCLHGGVSRLSQKIFTCESISETTDLQLRLSCSSADGESGFPGHLKVYVTYTLSETQLKIDYEAVSDADTVINLSNHSYFNLSGHNSGSILEHEIQINSQSYLPVNSSMIPEDISLVEGSVFDLREMRPLASALRAPDKQITRCGGYDHCYVLEGDGLSLAAKVQHPYNGRVLECWTTEPGLQLYTANHIDGLTGKGGAYYGKFPAFCLETQHYPDSPNRPEFPSVILRPGETFNSTTVYVLVGEV
jgi:aldose 1-epimerase